MAINVSQAFHRTSANSIDDTLTLTKAQMLAVNDNLMPSFYFTIGQDDGFLYLYAKSNEVDVETGKFRTFEGGGGGQQIQVEELPTASATLEGTILQYVGADDDPFFNGFFYECIENSGSYVWEQKDVQPFEDSTLESSVTSNMAVGAITSGTTLEQGTTFTEFVQKLLITEIAPTTTFTASGSGIKEVGTSVTPTLTLVINNVGTGTPVSIKFYSGSTLLDTKEYIPGTNTYTYAMENAITTNTTVKGVLEYKKSNDTNATIEKSAAYTFVMASYYGAVTSAPTDKAGIIALTKNVKNSKALTATFTLSNQRSCYAYPASFGNLTSIKDANNFEYLSSYTKTNVTVDDVNYNVYTLTDPVTASGFKQVYA